LTRHEKLKIAALVLAGVAVLAGALVLTVSIRNGQHQAEARSVLANCQQIEMIKIEIRRDKQIELKRLRGLEYYRSRPAELRQAVGYLRGSLRRFRARDCFSLPAVERYGLERPTR